MPISSGFSQDPNPNYYVRKPGKTEILDEAIYYKRDEAFERPVEVVNRPIIRETVFMPDRKPPPLAPMKDMYTIAPAPMPAPPPPPPPPPPPAPVVYAPMPMTTMPTTTTRAAPSSSFDLFRALGLNADCPCWAWILIILGFILLLALIGMCLYFILQREGHL